MIGWTYGNMSDIDRSGDIGLDGEIGARDQFLFHGEGEVGVGGSRGPTGLASEGGGGVNLDTRGYYGLDML